LSASFAIQALLVDSLILQEAKASSETSTRNNNVSMFIRFMDTISKRVHIESLNWLQRYYVPAGK